MPGRCAAPPAPAMMTFRPRCASVAGIVAQPVRRPMCGHDPCLVRHRQPVERLGGMAQRRPVGLAAHDDADDRFSRGEGLHAGDFTRVISWGSSGDAVRDQPALQPGNLVLQHQLALLQPLQGATGRPRPGPPGARSRYRGHDARCGVRAACAAASPDRSAWTTDSTRECARNPDPGWRIRHGPCMCHSGYHA